MRATLFVLATLVIAAYALLWHRRAIINSGFTAPDRLRRVAAQLRTRLELQQGAGPNTKSADRYEEFGAVMQELSLRTADPDSADEAISSYRQAVVAFGAEGKGRKGNMIDIHVGLLLHEFGLRSIDSDKLRECSEVLAKFLAPRKGKWPFQLPRQFYQVARAGALAKLGARIGDVSLLREALPLCAPSRKSVAKGKFKPPLFNVDAAAGYAMTVIGRELGDRAVLIDSVEASRRAIEAKKALGVPILLASSQDELGQALSALGDLDRDSGSVREAIELFEEALKNLSPNERPASRGEVQINKGRALTVLGKLEQDQAILSRALESHRDALGVFNSDWAPFQRADALDAMGEALFALANLRNEPDIATLAAESHRKAEAILRRGDLAGSLARVRRNIAAAEALRAS